MIDGAPPSDPPEPSQHEELPDRLRVHSLARTLGTTSRRVLDALTALDGRVRSAHSTVDRVDAVRVRDLLATHLETAGVLAASVHAPEASEEPESRLMLETQETRNADVERPHYMPLFVAPQPIPEPLADDEDVDDGPDYVADDSDADDEGQLDRPANRRRRRGRRVAVADAGSRVDPTVIRLTSNPSPGPNNLPARTPPKPTTATIEIPKIPKPVTTARTKTVRWRPAIVAGAAGDGVSRLLVTTTTLR